MVNFIGIGLLGIPQERIAQRLGVTQFVVHDHLLKTPELKNAINELVTKGFAINTIAEKLGADKAGAGSGEISKPGRGQKK